MAHASQLPDLTVPSNHKFCNTPCSFDSRGVVQNYDMYYSKPCEDCALKNNVCYLCDYCDIQCAFNDKGVTTDPVKFHSDECQNCEREQ